jgi:hypothetical protein
MLQFEVWGDGIEIFGVNIKAVVETFLFGYCYGRFVSIYGQFFNYLDLKMR